MHVRSRILGTLVAALIAGGAVAACTVNGRTVGRPCSNGKCPSGLTCTSGFCEHARPDGGAADAGSRDAGVTDAGPQDAGADGGITDGGIHLVEGHIGSGGGTVDDGNGLRLIDPSFEVGDRICAGALCESGGIEP